MRGSWGSRGKGGNIGGERGGGDEASVMGREGNDGDEEMPIPWKARNGGPKRPGS